eukprot:g60856.t1
MTFLDGKHDLGLYPCSFKATQSVVFNAVVNKYDAPCQRYPHARPSPADKSQRSVLPILLQSRQMNFPVIHLVV